MKTKILSITDRTWWAVLLTIVFGMIVFAIASCSSVRQAQRRLEKVRAAHPELFAQACADAFPVQTYDSIRTVLLVGKEVLRLDTVRVDCAEVSSDSQIVYVPCPPCLTRTDTLLRTWTQVRENTARVEQLQAERNSAYIKAAEVGQSRKWWMWAFMALCAYSAIRIALRWAFKISLP